MRFHKLTMLNEFQVFKYFFSPLAEYQLIKSLAPRYNKQSKYSQQCFPSELYQRKKKNSNNDKCSYLPKYMAR